MSDEALRRYKEVFASTVYETKHPVVRIHPVTGERHLLLGHFVKHLQGVSSHDSQHLFTVLQSYVTHLENTVRWHWQAGDVTIRENRATQHYTINDYGDAHRVTLAGDVVVGIDGQTSRACHQLARDGEASNQAGGEEQAAA